MKKQLAAFVKKYWLYPVYLVLCILSFSIAVQAATMDTAVSLRYNKPLSAQQAGQAIGYAQKKGFDTAFWRQDDMQSFKSGYHSSKATEISVLGNMEFAYPVQFTRGGYPSALDTEGCALSSALAWDLFGAGDVAGLKINAGSKVYTVRGVFQSDIKVLLAHNTGNPDESYQAVELMPPKTGEDSQLQPEDFANAAGLGAPDAVVYDNVFVAIANVEAWLPIILIILLGLLDYFRFHGSEQKLQKGKKEIILFSILFVFALCLPQLLKILPGWMIPTQWSDFSHWTVMIQNWSKGFVQWLSLKPGLRDVLAKELLIEGVLAAGANVFIAIALIKKQRIFYIRLK